MTRLTVTLVVSLGALLVGCPSGTEDPPPPIVRFEPTLVQLGEWTVTTEGLPPPETVRLMNRGFERVAVTGVGILDERMLATAAAELPAEVEPGGWLTVTVEYLGPPTGPIVLETTLDAAVRAVGASFDQFAVASAPVHLGLICDADGDGYTGEACAGPDCNDEDVFHNPASDELCNGLDDDCDGVANADDDEVDTDGDGFLSCDDCDDEDASVNPDAIELCDGVDTDCNPATFFAGGESDYDTDGFLACEECDDEDHDNAPGGAEVCDGEDNDCDGALSDAEIDDDGDGQTECDGDCDDLDAERNSFAVETPGDGVDSDCDGSDDE